MKFKRVGLFLIAMGISLSGCRNSGGTSMSKPNSYEEIEMTTDTFSVKIVKNSENLLSPSICIGTEEEALYSDEPIIINVRSKSSGIIETFSETAYSSGYTSFYEKDGVFTFKGEVRTSNHSLFLVEDEYSIENGALIVRRNISVKEAGEKDAGYSSTIRFKDKNSASSGDYDYFMPSIIYKDTENMISGAIFSNTDLVGKIYVKETRTGLPMMYMRNARANYAFSLAHIDLDISAGNLVGGGENGAVDDAIRYGGIGMTCTPIKSVDFVYPCAEGPVTYDSGSTWARRYHEMNVDGSDSFSVALYCERSSSYQDSMVSAYEKMYSLIQPSVAEIDIDRVYEDNLEIFKSEYKEFGSGDIVYAGEPWSLTLPNATINQGYSSQMGFVGQQIPVGYQLYRYGIENDDEETRRKGETILDFWSSSSIHGNYFPIVWWDPSDTGNAGSARSYPCFLRCMIDGMEGMLDAYLESVKAGEAKQRWGDVVLRFAENLVKVQNTNGSFYRAYNLDGTVSTDTSNANYQGTSELNTPISVRFLCKMYEFTEDRKYLVAAEKAAQYCYNNLYLQLGKYVGGTPDNPNTVDKEAAVYAMYAFTSIYMLTNEEEYLNAAKHAAISAMSWVYVYDFAVPCTASVEKINTMKDGGTKGFSLIATGHSAADNYAAYTYYELFKLAVLSGESVFRDFAYFIQNNTKLCTDYDGRMNFKYRALMPEATRVADFAFASVGTWLPWSAIANVEPIAAMEKTFGQTDVSKLDIADEQLKTRLYAYGTGGQYNG